LGRKVIEVGANVTQVGVGVNVTPVPFKGQQDTKSFRKS
jgi:hypothetical protein